MDLTTLRAEIDGIDDELLALFLRRMAISEQVARFKLANGGPILRPEREVEILRRMAAKAGPDMSGYTRECFEALLAVSRHLQEDVITTHNSTPK